MAEAFLKVLIDNLSSLIQREIGLIMGVDKEMKKLSNALITIHKVLEDAEHKQFQSNPIQNWLSHLNDVAYEIEDILDECNTEVSKMKSKFNLKKILFKYKIGRRVKEAVEKLNDVAEDRHKFHLHEVVVQQSKQVDWRRETGSVLNEPDHVYGRDEDREKIVDILVNQVSEQNISVLPIVGIGGMGKTTLAQLVYNDERVTQHFDTKLWVCVSDDFDIKAILKAMIESTLGSSSNLETLDSLQSRLRQELSGQRYLLILDDVWNDDQEDWIKLRSILACGAIGASVIVTTRLKKVGDIVGTLPAHCLTELSEEHCWLLFRLRAFGQDNGQYRNLEAIGRRIVKKCAGVPLAAKALGGLLRFQREEKEWIHVEESHIWNLPEEENSILHVLRLSYRHLPFVLKRCFVYCAVFPKDYRFDKTELIFHWMAHGCISSNGTLEVEDVGDQIWNELALRSFFQEVDTSGRETTFKMHDLVHDLAQSIMENKIPQAKTENRNTRVSNSRVREVHCMYHYQTSSSSIGAEVSTLTTIMNYNRLRILKLCVARTEELPSAISKLKHMRLLDLSRSGIHTLPRTFCCLSNLQILILNHCYRLKSLPKNIRHMTNLRHIFLEGCNSLSHMPYRIGELSSLKTLSLFTLGDKTCNQLNELEHLNLGGRLEIKHLESVQNHTNAKKANLVGKPNLRDLILRWESGNTSTKMDDEKVLEALEPHPNLATLEIHGFIGGELSDWMKKMKNLSRVLIQDCRECTHLAPLGNLPLLKSLHLRNLDGLEYIVEVQGTRFSSLEELKLYGLSNLKGLSKEEGVGEMFPNLRSLSFRRCQLLIETSICRGLNSVTELELWDCQLVHSCFAEGWLRHFTALEELSILGCRELLDVGEEIKHLHRLKRLSLELNHTLT
ncbi:hypothetical protein ACS0TY_021947 [Phlomoides rotata]